MSLISVFASLVGVPVDLTSSASGSQIGALTAGKYKLIIKVKEEKA